MTKPLEILGDSEVQIGRSKHRTYLERELLPFIRERLKDRDSVFIKQEVVQEVMHTNVRVNSIYSKLLLMLKESDIKVTKKTHVDGSAVFCFRYRKENDSNNTSNNE